MNRTDNKNNLILEKILLYVNTSIDEIVKVAKVVIENKHFQQHVDKMAKVFNGITTFAVAIPHKNSFALSVIFCILTSDTYLYVTLGLRYNEENHISNIFLRYDDLSDFRDKISLLETKEKILYILKIIIDEAYK